MKKLNNKGTTAIELVVCFTIILGITVALFDVITDYKTKQQTEALKSAVTTYKNSITKLVQTDIIMNHLESVTIYTVYDDASIGYRVDMTFTKPFTGTNRTKTLRIVGGPEKNYMMYHELGANNNLVAITYPMVDIGSYMDQSTSTKEIRFSNINVEAESNMLVIDATIEHNELSDYYHINIVAPLNY